MTFIYAPRPRNFDYVGYYRYFLTICTFNRTKVLVTDAQVQPIVLQLSHGSDAHKFSVPAYCLMPDHIHVLVAGEHETADFREFVRVFKHVLREEEGTFAVARYIIENPVRAGLVANPLDYPYIGSLTVSARDLMYSVQIQRT